MVGINSTEWVELPLPRSQKHVNTELLTTDEVADRYRVTPKTVRRWASVGAPYLKLPGGLRFEPEPLRAWLLAQALRQASSGGR